MRDNIRAMSLVLAIGISAPVMAQDLDPGQGFEGKQFKKGQRGQFGKRGGGRGMGKLQSVLTADQKTQVQQMMQQSREKLQPLVAKLKSLRGANTDSGAAIDQTEVQNLRAQIQSERKEMRAKIMALLTPEQKAQLKASKQNRRKLDQPTQNPVVQ